LNELERASETVLNSVATTACGSLGRSPSSSGITKILRWERSDNITEGKAFIGIVVYYRIWIEGFAIIAEPIYRLMSKGVEWKWDDDQQQAMKILQEKLTTAPILCKLHYDPVGRMRNDCTCCGC
jgi:hypothetical protein